MADEKNTNRILQFLNGRKKRKDRAVSFDDANKPNIATDLPRMETITRNSINRIDPATIELEIDDSDVNLGEPDLGGQNREIIESKPRQKAVEETALQSENYSPDTISMQTKPERSIQTQQSSDEKIGPQQIANQKPESGLKSRATNPLSASSNKLKIPQEKNPVSKASEGIRQAKDVVDWAQKGARAVAGNISAMAQLAVKTLKNIKNIKNIWNMLDSKNKLILAVTLASLVLVIVLAITIPLSFFSWLSGSPNPATGHDQPQLVNPSLESDGKLIKQVLALTGDQTTNSELIDNGLDKVKLGLATLKDNYSSKTDTVSQEIVAKIELVDQSISTLKATKNTANADSFLSKLSDLDNAIENTFPAFTTATKAPVPITDLLFNASLHGKSKLNPDPAEANNVYTSNDQGFCDAVDISAEPSDPVYPIFEGKIITIKPDGANGKYVVVQNGDYRMLYAHLINNDHLTVGTNIKTSESLGNVKIDHVQIETMYQNQCLTTTYGDLIDFNRKAPKHSRIGGYLWDRIVKKFLISL